VSTPALKVTLWCLIIAAQIFSMPFVILAGNGSAPKTYAMAGGVFAACLAAGFAVDSL
jgi:hypothetical protein